MNITPEQIQWIADFKHGDSFKSAVPDGPDVIVTHEDNTRTRLTPDGDAHDEPAE